MNNEPRDQVAELLDNATSGLRDDPELQLEVRAELATHLDAAEAELRGKGISEEDSRELALKGFGSSVEIAEDLVSANRTRMKLRALARLTARAVVVPLAVVLAVWIFINTPMGFYWNSGGSWSERLESLKGSLYTNNYTSLVSQIPEDKLLLWQGDLSRGEVWEQQRAIWEAEPDNKVYYANYITYLVEQMPYIKDPTVSYPQPDLPDSITPEFIEGELRRGMEIEPDNARYNYLLASFWLSQAGTLTTEFKHYHYDKPTHYILEIEDLEILDKAMAEMLKGIAKPYLKTYDLEMLVERSKLLPSAHTFAGQFKKYGLLMNRCIPDRTRLQLLGCATGEYAKVLASQGRNAEASRILETWYPFCMQIARDATFTGDYFALVFRIIKNTENNTADIFAGMGMPEKAEETRRNANRLYSIYTEWNAKVKSSPESTWFKEMQTQRSSSIAGMFLAANYSLLSTEEDFTPGRLLEHLSFERMAVAILLTTFLILMVGSILIALLWRLVRGVRQPILILPGSSSLANILGFGVFLPLLLFWFYTRVSGIAGREYSLNYLGFRFMFEAFLLGTTILYLTTQSAARTVRDRCKNFAMPVPPLPGKPHRVLPIIFLIVAWGACLFLREKKTSIGGAVIIGSLLTISIIFYLIFLLMKICDGRQKERRVISKKKLALTLLLMAFVIGFLTYCLFIPPALHDRSPVYHLGINGISFLRRLKFVLILFLPLIFFRSHLWRWLHRGGESNPEQAPIFGFYYGTVARSLVPVFAAAVILLAVMTQLYFNYSEADLVSREKFFSIGTAISGVPHRDSPLVEKFKAEIERVAAEIEAEKESKAVSE